MPMISEITVGTYFSSVPYLDEKHNAKRVCPTCLMDAKVVAVTGVTGRVSRVNLEAKREDRYDSIDIDWDHGGKSYGVFLCAMGDGHKTKGLHFFISQDKLNVKSVNLT